jgi:hypothetical protein
VFTARYGLIVYTECLQKNSAASKINKKFISHLTRAKRTSSAAATVQVFNALTLSLLMLHICGVSKTFGEWHQKTNKTEDTNKLTLLSFKIIILHNTRLATFVKLLETVSKGLFMNR